MVLTPIKCHLSFLPGCITHLREFGLVITDSLAILDEVKEKINNILAPKGKGLPGKAGAVLGKEQQPIYAAGGDNGTVWDL